MSAERQTGQALWYVGRGIVELRDETIPQPAENEVLVRALYSAVSRGTERLILSGAVGPSEWERMRAPLQSGAFPFPVKYGYCAAGIVEEGASHLVGRKVFVLHPHQDRFIAPAAMAVPIPEPVPARRATLAANMETALNAIWDSDAGPGDRVVVVGAGVVGLLVGYLAARLPGAAVTIADIAEERTALARRLGLHSCQPADLPSEADIVFHASATAGGLAAAIAAAGFEAAVVELSWYGEGTVAAPLGGAFHSRRLRLISSQVGHVSAGRRPRWNHRRRLETALALLAEPRLDLLLGEEIALAEAPLRLPALLASGVGGPAPVIRYPSLHE
jgi:threonine dehydrogenase-like Zn-dependent dehydrogenase